MNERTATLQLRDQPGPTSQQLRTLDSTLPQLTADQKRVAATYRQLDCEDAYEKQWGVANPVAGDYWRKRDAIVFQSVVEHFKYPLTSLKVLEVGVGHGHELAKFAQLGIPQSNLTGVDVVYERLIWAKSVYPAIAFAQQDATKLLFPDATFDIVCQFLCFEHLPGREAQRLACQEMVRVLKPGGLIIWWDMAPVGWLTILSRRLHEISRVKWSQKPMRLLDSLKRAVHEAFVSTAREDVCRKGCPEGYCPVAPRDLEQMFAGLKVAARRIGTDYYFWWPNWYRRRAIANLFWHRGWLSTYCFATVIKP